MDNKQELIKNSEFYLEDIHEGLIALDNALKLVGKDGQVLPMSRGQAIGVVWYVAGAVGRDIERMREVRKELPKEEAEKLDQFNQQLKKRMEKIHKLLKKRMEKIHKLKLLSYT